MSHSVLGAVFALGSAACWALAVNLFKLSAERVSAEAMNLFKSTLALLVFMPLVFAARPDVSGADFWKLAASGLLGISVADTLFFWSLRRVTATQAALLGCLYAPSVVALAFLLLGESIQLGDLVGGLLIVAGVVLAVERKGRPGRATTPKSVWGILVGCLAVAFMGLSIIVVKPLIETHPVTLTTTARLFGGSLGIAVWIALRSLVGYLRKVPAPFRVWRELATLLTPQPVWRKLIPGAIVGNVMALYLWIGGFKYTTATTAALLNQTNTLLIVAIAVVFFGERLTRRSAFALVLGFGGCVTVIAV